MAVTVTVSEVRQALYQAAGGAMDRGDGSPSLAVLGQWFHEALGKCVGDDTSPGWLTVLGEVDADLELWKQALVECAYSQFVGPRLTREQAALHDVTPQVLTFWQALQAACHWMAELSWSARPERASRGAQHLAPWQTLAEWFTTEEPLSCELREPGWSDSVRLVGVADAVVRLTSSGAWCAIEFKLGQTSPTADLGQACLYHLMLSAAQASSASNEDGAGAGTLALISFRPQRHERLFAATELAVARERLIDLIGKLAGVDATQAVAPTVQSGPTDGSKPPPISTVRVLATVHPAEEHLQLGKDLVRTLAEYGVHVSLDEPPIVGPTFLRFRITLGRGTRVHAVERHAAELQMRLALKAEPFVNRDDGRLVIDVQRPDRQTVWFEDIRSQLPTPDARLGGSHVPVGVDLSGQLVCADLAKTEHAHLLVAGTTGSGKSEWLRLAIAGLIATNTPETLRLLIIDPKRNAFHSLRESPYLWQPLVFPDEQPAAEVLRELAAEMDRRYRQLDGADSHAQLVARSDVPLPRIVCVCDEYRDLISRSRDERKLIEAEVCRLGAKARAAGIHLILATQEPRRETIIGPLDANMPARVGLKMGKSLESNMLLGVPGAENLLGYGDLLFKDVGPPRRLQAPLLSPNERDAIFGKRQ
jgi:DNA segregation ATPase FtsK/SpoIIIE, S-DNA-T family